MDPKIKKTCRFGLRSIALQLYLSHSFTDGAARINLILMILP